MRYSSKMAEVEPAGSVERKPSSQIPRSDLEVCCKRRLFIFEQIIWHKKLTINKCNFWCCYLAEKLAFWALLPNER